MTKILIDVNRAGDAIKWAAVHFGSTFNVQHDFPSTKYGFEFDDAAQASLFALKCI
jgi:hypothetical protein